MEERNINQEKPVEGKVTSTRIRRSTPQLTEDEMFQIIKTFKVSGLTRRKFCLESNYPMSNFYYWQKKYYDKFPEEVEDKPRRGRKSKKELEGKVGESVTSKPVKERKQAEINKNKKTAIKPKVSLKAPTRVSSELTEIPAEPKRIGRPRKIDSADQGITAVIKKAKKIKGIKPSAKVAAVVKNEIIKTPESLPEQKLSGPVMQIRYPNGVRIILPADISAKRIKELLNL